MTKELALAMRSASGTYAVHRQQLQATELFLSEMPNKDSLHRTSEGLRRISQSGLPLMELPYDVRHTILEHLVDSQTIRAFLKWSEIALRLPVLARAGNRLLRRECILVALKSSTIEIHSGPGNDALQSWLKKISFEGVETFCKNGYDAVCSLKFPYFSRFPHDRPGITVNHDVLLSQECKHLRKISIDFQYNELGGNGCRDPVIKDAATLRTNYQLDGLLECSHLEKLEIQTSVEGAKRSGIDELIVWFTTEFQKRGQKTVVSLA